VVNPTEQEDPMPNELDPGVVAEARTMLATWLAEHSVAPDTWTPEVIEGWRTTRAGEWLLFQPPGYANRAFLVAGSDVFSFAPSRHTLAEALAAARTDRPEDVR
jgi:hypothetical protein